MSPKPRWGDREEISRLFGAPWEHRGSSTQGFALGFGLLALQANEYALALPIRLDTLSGHVVK